MLLLLTTIKF